LEAVQGYTLLCTDRNGWIEVSTDGEQMWVEVERLGIVFEKKRKTSYGRLNLT
jgi:uncharacterized protein YraI